MSAGLRASASQGAGRLGSVTSLIQDPHQMKSKFRKFLDSCVPSVAQPNLMSMFTRLSSTGYIDLRKTESLSDLLHEMHKGLMALQARDAKRYAELAKMHGEAMRVWEARKDVAEEALTLRADELRLSSALA